MGLSQALLVGGFHNGRGTFRGPKKKKNQSIKHNQSHGLNTPLHFFFYIQDTDIPQSAGQYSPLAKVALFFCRKGLPRPLYICMYIFFGRKFRNRQAVFVPLSLSSFDCLAYGYGINQTGRELLP
jgi:hypothetical protein